MNTPTRTRKLGTILAVIGCVLLLIGILAGYAFIAPSTRAIQADTTTMMVEPLKYQSYCLKGKSVLKVYGGTGNSTAGYLYEIDDLGRVVSCPK